MTARTTTLPWKAMTMPTIPLRSALLLAAAATPLLADAAPALPAVELVPLAKARIVLAEDFESTAVGAIPAGYTKKGAVGVVDDVAHTGKHSLRIEAAINGAREIIKTGEEITALGGQHWGRLFYKVQLPAAQPLEGKIVHSTMVEGTAESPLDKQPIQVRVLGSLVNTKGAFDYLYNVQPLKGRKEFATFTPQVYHYSDSWVLAEWYVDYATQTYRFFVDGQELSGIGLHKGEGNFAGAEIPPLFTSMAFGWCNYQPVASGGFVAWIDDIVLSKDRIGGQTALPVASTASKP
jgi:hypothetical protein